MGVVLLLLIDAGWRGLIVLLLDLETEVGRNSSCLEYRVSVRISLLSIPYIVSVSSE